MTFISQYTDAEKIKILEEYNQSDDKQSIARAYNVDTSTIRRWRQKIDLAENNDHKVPLGMSIKGVSTLYDPDGNVKQEWVKVDRDKAKQEEALRAFVEGLKSEITPIQPIEFKEQVNDDLLSLYVLSDFHLGMYADKEEGGEDWNLEIAEQKLMSWIKKAVTLSPEAHTGVFLNLGDLLHANGAEPVTPASKHALDISSRFHDVVKVAVKGIRYGIAEMLKKHKHVHLVNASANHDPDANTWMQTLFEVLYENEPRVTVDTTPHPYYCYEWGDTSLFMHHGHKRNLNNVSQVFAGYYRDVFGRTKYSFGHLGHFHHSAAREDSLMHVQIHPTLAAKDAYASHSGYVSQRKAKTIIYSKKFGEVGSIVITPDML